MNSITPSMKLITDYNINKKSKMDGSKYYGENRYLSSIFQKQ